MFKKLFSLSMPDTSEIEREVTENLCRASNLRDKRPKTAPEVKIEEAKIKK